MKKYYNRPVTEISIGEPLQVICASKSISLDKGSTWGAFNNYGPAEWVNEQQQGIEVGQGFTAVPAGDDPNDWASRSNESFWN